MTARRMLVLVAAAGLLAAAVVAGWRSAHDTADPAATLAAQLRCPSCQGESVAASRSPVAAAMREVIATQLAAGRSPEQVRAWFVERYGGGVLDKPANRGIALLLWVIPALTCTTVVLLAARSRRRRRGPPRGSSTSHAPSPAVRGADTGSPRRIWDLVAVGLVGLVAVMAVVGPRAARRADRDPPAATADPVAAQVALAQTLEQQGDFAAAAAAYREAASQRPDDEVRVRQAFALIRAGQPAEAAAIAEQVLAAAPDNPDALLMLGLAQRATHSATASATLRRFLQVAPNHPAAPEISRLLAGS